MPVLQSRNRAAHQVNHGHGMERLALGAPNFKVGTVEPGKEMTLPAVRVAVAAVDVLHIATTLAKAC